MAPQPSRTPPYLNLSLNRACHSCLHSIPPFCFATHSGPCTLSRAQQSWNASPVHTSKQASGACPNRRHPLGSPACWTHCGTSPSPGPGSKGGPPSSAALVVLSWAPTPAGPQAGPCWAPGPESQGPGPGRGPRALEGDESTWTEASAAGSAEGPRSSSRAACSDSTCGAGAGQGWGVREGAQQRSWA
jgi:hypothetical protein